MRAAIVMPHYNRTRQLYKTLSSIKSEIDDFVVIVVDDGSDDVLMIPHTDYPIHALRIPKEEKTWFNPEPAYNMGFYEAITRYNPDIIISQNSECFHVGDVVKYAVEHITNDNYITFAAFSLGEKNTFDEHLDLSLVMHRNSKCASFDGEDAWYNHPVHRPCYLEFCSAISTANLIKLNGYDERLAFGIGWGDNYLLHRIRLMGLKVEPIVTSPFVVHQWHYNDEWRNAEKGQLTARNYTLYSELLKENNYRGVHLTNPDFESITN